MSKIVFILFITIFTVSLVKASENIFNLKDCHNVFVGRSLLFSKNDKNFNINFATKKNHRSTFLWKG